jgi:GNAT superfamily N-acetyltransferase
VSNTVRRADQADAEVLSRLNADVQNLHAAAMPQRFKKVGSNTFPVSESRAILANPNSLIFIADVDLEPAGYAYAEVVRHPETSLVYAWDEVHLHHISVDSNHRRNGIGCALLNSVRAAADKLGITVVTLSVWAFNEDARTFFQRRGFGPYMFRLSDRPMQK